ncbi:MAG: CRISPR-associated endonuclease Cas2 [Polyangiaceae bacterium]|jgi:CRISPR-associated protein Cas2
MRVVVTYDVETLTKEGRSRLRRIAKVCKSFGVRVQLSVFECSVGAKELVSMRARLLDVMDAAKDSLRIWFVSDDDARKTEHYGIKAPLDPDGPLIV